LIHANSHTLVLPLPEGGRGRGWGGWKSHHLLVMSRRGLQAWVEKGG
jgi:hypothetical protein